ncbi:DUF2309 domain-containing protein [Paludisphaera mucosa]|uniref:Probable inorganic carbon transporter subunit DabA n=1 Tax=Paludisphaera mucosa TaxID=3030827 RepID=A0ABT6F9Y5_9BACT|nr:DUF2309 domain-containing protein [Paludisphaera mucosa]MDG3004322.1 DUF2309 domain-containing protein [Paludisphaera mucosa]
MLESPAIVEEELSAGPVADLAARVARRIPPLWDLDDYVAVNPFLGFSARPIDEAAREIGDGLGARVFPGVDYYRERWRRGAFGPLDLAAAASRHGRDAAALEEILDGRRDEPRRPERPALGFAERYDRAHGSDWDDRLIRSAARWCAVYATEGGSYWRRPPAGAGLYASWREAERVDRSLEIAGLQGWRDRVGRLPDRPEEAIAAALTWLDVPAEGREPYLYHLLGGLYGWASYLRRRSWREGGADLGGLLDLMAVRIAGDAVFAAIMPGARPPDAAAATATIATADESVSLVFQEAWEDGFDRALLGRLATPPEPAIASRPAVQAVFCIDVRSEPLRRRLEAQAGEIVTLGFAGFFGVALEWQAGGGGARCPVLLKPSVRLRPTAPAGVGGVRGVLKQVQAAPAAAFSFVELLGLAYGVGLARDALAATPRVAPAENAVAIELTPDGRGRGVSTSDRIDLAAGILKNMGLRPPFARLALLCGHAGRSANNPHAAGLDCGACGGHGGALNARVAAAVLNDPEVRVGLRGRGWDLPADMHFLPGVHDTSVDEVALLDLDEVPPGHEADVERLGRWLEQAGAEVRAERAAKLGLAGRPARALGRRLDRRARDWSEVRPEWGLARNAAFIAARRVRTRGVDLDGRAFLHEYDSAADPDGSVLALILAAPMVVASWINLQYLASTVDNDAFGCGSKTLHNRVGSLGVVLGNGGDLRTGLPAQSVHGADGGWYHEPLRLQVIVEAPPDKVRAVMSAQPGVGDLVENGWVRLLALDPAGPEASLWVPGRGWVRVAASGPAADRRG